MFAGTNSLIRPFRQATTQGFGLCKSLLTGTVDGCRTWGNQTPVPHSLPHNATSLPNFKTADGLVEWGKRVLEGEKARIKKGGRPIYNPTIGMVSTHWDIFKNIYEQQKSLQNRTQKALDDIQKLRPEIDEILLDLWNQIEKHFEKEPPEMRFEACRKFGVIYYYRRNEKHLY